MRDRHKIQPGSEDDFQVQSMAEFANTLKQITSILTLLLGAVASVALLVGGIGIMNIMLVSVTERTREIGIRIAIGATEGDVQLQFLIEAVMLSLIGGVIGITVGELVSWVVDLVLSLDIHRLNSSGDPCGRVLCRDRNRLWILPCSTRIASQSD